jgi:hypothetical protein
MVGKDPNINTNQNNSFINDEDGNVARNTVINSGKVISDLTGTNIRKLLLEVEMTNTHLKQIIFLLEAQAE